MKLYKSILFLWAMALTTVASAQVQNAHFDTNGVNLGQRVSILLGDQVEVVTSLPLSQGAPTNFPPLEFYTQNNILALSMKFDTTELDSKPIVNQHVVVTSFELGEHRLGIDSITDSLVIEVRDVENIDTTKAEIKDLAKNFREPYTFWEIFRWVLLALAVAAIVYFVVLWMKKREKNEPIIQVHKEPPLSPIEQALKELEELRQKELWQHGRQKEYHTQLTDILRQYLQKRYGINSTEMTSDQTLEAFQGSLGFTQERYDQLRQIFRTADMVKFAKAEPASYEHDLAMSIARTFIAADAEQQQEQKEEAQ